MKTLISVIVLFVGLLIANTLNAQLTATAGNTQVICTGDSVILGGNPTATGGTGPYTYAWTPSTALSCNGCPNPVAYPTINTIYTVFIEDASGDTTSAWVSVVVNPSPVVNLIQTGDGIFPDTLETNVTGGCIPYLYNWDSGTPVVQSNGVYSVTVTDCNGCVTTASTTVSNPSITVSYPNGGENLMVGQNITLQWNSTAVSGNVKIEAYNSVLFNWVTVISSTPNTGGYVMTVPNLPGTQSKIRVSSVNNPGVFDESDAFFNITNVLPLQVAAYDTTICTGENVQLAADVWGGTPPYTYAWLGNTGDISDTTLAAPVFTPTASTKYWVVVTDSNGLTATDSMQINIVQNLDSSLVTSTFDGSCNIGGRIYVYQSNPAGVQPFSYVWSNSMANWFGDNLIPGVYTITVIDAQGCTGVISDTIYAQSSLLVTFSQSNPCNPSFVYGSVINDGVTPYTYQWSNGSTAGFLQNPSPGNYALTVSDNTGCSGSATVTVSGCSGLQIDQVSTTPSCYGTATGSACISVSGGVLPYSYQWQFNIANSTSSCAYNLAPGNYGVTVTDVNNTTVSVTVTISYVPDLNVNIVSATGDVLPDTLTAVVTGGTPPYTFFWKDASANLGTTQSIIVNSPSISAHSVLVRDSMNCAYGNDSVVVGCNSNCVWPGDADYSGVVDNNDLLAIGIGYGTTGTARLIQGSPAQLGWVARPSQNWADTLLTGVNFKHIDCDGNGTIHADDTAFILYNYSLTHPRSGGIGEPRGGVPMLRIEMVPDTLADGETVIAHLSLGDSLNTASNVYGLAFTFNFDPQVVDSNEVSISFLNNSWLCNNAADHIDIDKKFFTSGEIKTALTRIDHTTRSGSGEIGSVSMKITTGNINGKNLEYYSMLCYISDLVVIDEEGNYLPVDAGFDSATIEYEPTGIRNIRNQKPEIRLFPNPVNDILNVSVTGALMEEIQIMNLLGEVVLDTKTNKVTQIQISTSELTGGVYLVKVKAGGKEVYDRLVK